jgi:predicted metalloprotease
VNYLEDTVFIVNAFWEDMFSAAGLPYEHVGYAILGRGAQPQTSNCVDSSDEPAIATPESGPFYCSIGGEVVNGRVDGRGAVYIGVPLLVREANKANRRSFDFAVVAVVVHEFGHHVEHLLVDIPELGVSETSATWWELGADCLAGVFAHAAYYGLAGQLTDTDFQEAVNLLYRWGNDLPYDLGGDPHGTHDQRVEAFTIGYNTGSAADCLTAEWPTS